VYLISSLLYHNLKMNDAPCHFPTDQLY